MRDYDWIIQQMEKDNISFICNIEIDYEDFKQIFPEKERHGIKRNEVSTMEKALKIYPLYGGSMDQNRRINLVVGLKSEGLKLERIQEDFEFKIKLKKRS